MSKYTKEDIIRLVKENDVHFIRLQFTDIFGALKNLEITASQLNKALNNEIMFDGSSIEGFVRIEESDQNLRPDLNSFKILPWQPSQGRIARLICDVYNPDGQPFVGDPRYVLKKAIEEAKSLGYSFDVGPELEFFLIHMQEGRTPVLRTHDHAGYFDLGPSDLGEDARRDMCIALESMGFEIEASHHEVADGQHEIDFKYGSAIPTADNIMTFKMIVRTIAREHGLMATFMPKPFWGINGSGMHTNMSLRRDGKNVFYDPDDDMGLSKEAYGFIAGIMEHMKGMTLITNPIVNSYKRLVPGYEAPVYIAWSAQNRSPLIRVPATRGAGTRVELRCPDPTCNPYLEMAVLLRAGLDGIKRGLTPPKSVEFNIFDLTPAEREQYGIDCLPGSLEEAIFHFRSNELIRETLGDHIFFKMIEAKTQEWEEYRMQVHKWETDRYILS